MRASVLTLIKFNDLVGVGDCDRIRRAEVVQKVEKNMLLKG